MPQFHDGVYCGPGNTHCRDCDNGFGCNVETGEAAFMTGKSRGRSIPGSNKKLTKRDLDAAVRTIDRNPTEAEKEAWAIIPRLTSGTRASRSPSRDAAGSTRSGKTRVAARRWSVKMGTHYGYAKQDRRSEADGDHIDILLADEGKPENRPSTPEVVFVINQNKQDGSFDDA